AMLGARLTAPLAELRARADRLAAGDLETRVRPRGPLEIQRLGEAFNAMAGRLRAIVARESEERGRYETIFTAMADGIVITDAEGRIELFNPAARRLLDVAPEATFGRSLLEVTLHSGLWELLERSVREGAAQTSEVRISGSEVRVLRVHAAPVSSADGHLGGIVLVLQDLTEARRLEEMRRDFVGNVSHELKSPVAALRALAET